MENVYVSCRKRVCFLTRFLKRTCTFPHTFPGKNVYVSQHVPLEDTCMFLLPVRYRRPATHGPPLESRVQGGLRLSPIAWREACRFPSTLPGKHARPFARSLKATCTLLNTFPGGERGHSSRVVSTRCPEVRKTVHASHHVPKKQVFREERARSLTRF